LRHGGGLLRSGRSEREFNAAFAQRAMNSRLVVISGRRILAPAQVGPAQEHHVSYPHSHRKITIDDLREAQRQVLQASRLLHVIDAANGDRRSLKRSPCHRRRIFAYGRDLAVCSTQEQHLLLARCFDDFGVKSNVACE
jgi:hypothetical protein